VTAIRVSALIPAAGSGERLGLGPKALLDLGGRTLVERAVEALAFCADEVIVALPLDRLDARLPQGTRVIAGGSTRQDTVEALVRTARGEIVIVHDAARPFLPRRVASEVLEAATATGAATAALSSPDTLVREEATRWGGLIDRAHVRAVQTPQAFRRELLVRAHDAARQDGSAATDDAGLVARLGLPVALVEGDPRLFKLTRRGDWELAVAFAAAWDEGER
jgi:2-C-methyl-D-erythritol 4-phosphate cytidylyltransferase